MNDNDNLLPGEEDPVLDGYLHGLHRFGPRPGFEDRVLARVWRPAPMFLLVWRDRARRALTPRRVWAATGLAAAGSTVWLVNLAAWLAANLPGPAEAQAWFAMQLAALPWDAMAAGAASAAVGAAGQLAGIAELPGPALGAIAGALLTPAVSALGLFYLFRRTARERLGTHAAR